MLSELHSRRADGCLSDLVFDSWQAGELEPEREDAALEHLAGCPHCTARREQLDRERSRFLARAPEFTPPTAPAARLPQTSSAKQSRAAWLAGALALTAVLAVVAGKLSDTPELSDDSGTRSKGPAHLSFFVKRGEHVFEALPGQAVAPGDQLRFTVTSARPTYLAVLSLDAAGTASVYHPSAGANATPVGASRQHPLESAVELDGVLGRELVFGVFCNAAFAIEPLRQKLAAEHTLTAPPGCELDRLELVKESLP